MLSRHARLLFGCTLTVAAAAAQAQTQTQTQEDDGGLVPVQVTGTDHRLQAPPGTTIEKLADLSSPRLISLGENGEMFIGSHAGRVYHLTPPYDDAQVLANIDNYPHSVALREGRLYVATTDALLAADYRQGEALDAEDFEEIAPLPGGGGHNSRTLVTGPDERLYVALGVQGNCSDQYIGEAYRFENRRGGVMVLDESGDSPQWQPYATGLRNPIGLAWDHQGVLYAINNGPDHWGYDEPREVLVRAEEGRFFGMPWFQWVDGHFQRDDCIDTEPPRAAEEAIPPVATLPARSAPMDLDFVPRESGLPLDAVAAVHGSWATQPRGGAGGNPASRREPSLVAITLEGKDEGAIHALITGFQDEAGRRWARPVGVAFTADDTLYFTSDSGETGLYRVTFDADQLRLGETLSKSR